MADVSEWNNRWNYHLGGEPRSVCACPNGPYEGARLATLPRFCERCGGLVDALTDAEHNENGDNAGRFRYDRWVYDEPAVERIVAARVAAERDRVLAVMAAIKEARDE